jgi:predicted GNAT family acetyltransferase
VEFLRRPDFPNLRRARRPKLADVTDVKVQDDPGKNRFEILVDGALGGFAAYRIKDGLVIITHSEIDQGFRGQGLGGQLAGRTLDQLRERGARVVPSCPFFADYVAQHREWDDIIER